MVGLSQMFTPKGLGEQVKNYVEKNQNGDNKITPMKNPFFEEVPVVKRKKPTGKFKTVKRNPSFEHINEHDRKLLKRFRKLAWTFDNGLGVKRFRVGWCTIIGLLIPVGGDVIDALLMCMLIHYAGQISGGKKAKDVQKMRKKMIGNLTVAICVGLVPGAGAIVDNFFRCNTRNAGLLEALLEERELNKATRPIEADREGRIRNRENTVPNVQHHRRGTEDKSGVESRNIASRQQDNSAERHGENINASKSNAGRFFELRRKPTRDSSAAHIEEPVQRQETWRARGQKPKAPQGFF